MKVFNNLLKKENCHELVLSIIFFIYLLFDIKTPAQIASVLNNIIGLCVIIIAVIYLLINSNPILGVLSVLVAYELIRRSDLDTTQLPGVEKTQPSEEKKEQYYSKFNKVPVTLEEELVRKLTPNVRTNRILDGKPVKNNLKLNNNKYKPVLDSSELKAASIKSA
tara:strand:- start:118 stop:612 length:495 start_codon:yes stop_codon:yes gene_type:complete